VWLQLMSGNKRRLHRLPERVRIYAVADLLDQVLSRIDADLADPDCHPLQVFLGDYIERGPSSRAEILLAAEQGPATMISRPAWASAARPSASNC